MPNNGAACYASVDRLRQASCQTQSRPIHIRAAFVDQYIRQSISNAATPRSRGRLLLFTRLKAAALDQQLTMRVPVTYVMMAFRTGEHMDLFRHHDRQASERAVREGTGRMEERPDWMRDGANNTMGISGFGSGDFVTWRFALAWR